MKEKQTDVVIIGAGLTGLATAFFLKEKGKRVLVVERSAQAGGAIRTYREQGYIFESGPNTGSVSHPEIVELFEKLPSCRLQTARPEANRRLICKKGKLRALPDGLLSACFTPLFSWKDKFGIFLEPFRKKGIDPDESIASLAKRRLGASMLNYAVDPFISGIYAGDPQKIVTRYALPKLYALEENYGSFIRGAIRKAKEPKTERDRKATKKVFSAEGGLGTLIDALVQAIGQENIILNNSSIQISGEAYRWHVQLDQQELTVPHLITTSGAHTLPALFPFAPDRLLQSINNLRYAKVVQVSVGMPQFPGMDTQAFGALIPSLERRKILGILYPSSCFDGRSPEGKVVLSIFMGGIRHPEIIDLPDEAIRALVDKELKDLYKLDELLYDYFRIFRHPYAIPQYEKSTGERLQAVEEFQQMYPGIILGGNLRDGVGMGHRIKQAAEMAAAVCKED